MGHVEVPRGVGLCARKFSMVCEKGDPRGADKGHPIRAPLAGTMCLALHLRAIKSTSRMYHLPVVVGILCGCGHRVANTIAPHIPLAHPSRPCTSICTSSHGPAADGVTGLTLSLSTREETTEVDIGTISAPQVLFPQVAVPVYVPTLKPRAQAE